MTNKDIFPIAATTIDWDTYVRKAHNYLGRSPTRSIDDKGIRAGSHESYLASLGEFQNKYTDPHKFLTKKDIVSAHLSFSFLCFIERDLYLKLLEYCGHKLIITKCNDLDKPGKEAIIVTGTLEDWAYYIINYLREPYEAYVRDFLHHILLILEKAGFKFYFSSYRRTKLIDESFILEKL